MIKIIFIAGDGRSGSTLLEGILANADDSVSIGECHRFWTRYVENKSHCGCGEPIRECELWGAVHSELSAKFPDYDPKQFMYEVREFQRYKNFKQMPQLLKEERWARFSEIVAAFYETIAAHSEKNTIIDSSKSIPWARLLQSFTQFDVRVIHLERNLAGVANSWKKKVRLPEYRDEKVFMPTKSNTLIIKTWLKVKLLSRKLPSVGKYHFVRYEQILTKQKETLDKVIEFSDLKLASDQFTWKPNHAVGGNPVRHREDHKITIDSAPAQIKELTILERIGFSLVDKLARFVGP